MALTIDNLEIQIQTEARKATDGVDALANSLRSLKDAVGNSGELASNLTQISNALKSFSSIGKINLTSPIKQIEKLNGLASTLGGEETTRLAQNLRDIADGLSALSSVKGVSITPVANGIKALSDASKSLDPARLEQFSQQMKHIAEGLSNLSGVGKTNIGSTINALKKIPEITDTLKPEVIEQFADKVRELTIVMTPLAEQMDKIARGFNALPNSIKKAVNATERATTSNKKLNQSYGSLTTQLSNTISKYRNLYYAAQRVYAVLKEWFNESNEYIESLNLFTVSLGDATDAATEYANAVSDALGIDPSEWMQNQGVFMRMATGFGIASDKAELMSQNLTQLAYDLSSFFNTDVETAMQKLQSGMSGQIKGLKAWGYNLSVAALQETALSLGIEKSVRSMSEAEKAQLRYITLIQKSNGIMGDMAKTITSPANAMRVLDAQMTQLKRSLGNLVSVLITKFIPWIMAAVELMTEFADALAEAWGFEVPEFPEVDLELGSDDIEETEEELQALKKQLMGFDELNILKSQDEGESENWLDDFKLPEYDFLNGLEGLDLEPYKQKLQEILDLVKLIGITMLAWKVGSGLADFINVGLPQLMNFFGTGSTSMPMIAGSAGTFASKMQLAAGAVLSIVGAFLEFKGVESALEEGFDFENIANTLIGSGAVVTGGALIGQAFGSAIVGGAVGTIAAGLIMFVPATADAIENGVDLENTLLSVGGGALTGAGIGFLIGGPIGAAIGAGIGAGIAGATQGIIATVQYAMSDCVEAVEIFDESISETTRQKVEPFLNSMRELSDLSFEWEVTGQKMASPEQIEAWESELAKLESIEVLSPEEMERIKELNALLSDTTSIETYTSKFNELADAVQAELDADKSTFIETLSGLNLGIADSTNISAQLAEYYGNAESELQAHKDRVAEITQAAANENRSLTTEEWAEINSIQAEMQDLGVAAYSESAVEYETIMRNLKDNSVRMSLEQASEVIKNAQATRDEAIAAAEDQYSRTLLEAEKMYAVGAIGREEYEAIKEAAKSTRDEAVAAANEQYDDIYNATTTKLGETSKYIDEETGEIKSKWEVMWEDIGTAFKDGWEATKKFFTDTIPDWWENTVVPWGEGIAESFSEWWGGVEEDWSTFKTNFKQGWSDFWGGLEAKIKTPHFEWTSQPVDGWMADVLSAIGLEPSLPKLNVEWYASGGFPSMGEMFIARESGPELVGRIGNKNAVANNDQITAGIASAVYSAMMAAKEDGNGGGGNARIIVQIGDQAVGEASIRYINGQIVQTGMNPIYS